MKFNNRPYYVTRLTIICPTHSCCSHTGNRTLTLNHFNIAFTTNDFPLYICYAPISDFLNLANSFPCSGLVIKSANISPVGQYSMFTLPFSTWSVMKKYLMFIALVLLLELFLPFLSNRMALLLSWYTVFFST